MKLLAIGLFVMMLTGLLFIPKYRLPIAIASAIVFVLSGIVPYTRLIHVIDFNVLMMIGGTMGLVVLFIDSKMPARLADLLVNKTARLSIAIVALAAFAGIISAFVDNVATVLMVAPVAIEIAKKAEVSPVGMVIAIAISSNLQGAATLVGDTTSILLGGYANMTFLDFFIYQGRIGLFFVVQIGAIVATTYLYLVLRNLRQKIHVGEIQEVDDLIPTFLLLTMIILLIAASFITQRPALTNGMICVVLFLVGLIRQLLIHKKFSVVQKVWIQLDFVTLGVLVCLFIAVGGLVEAGIIDDISQWIVLVTRSNRFLIFTTLVFGSVILSAFIDNIPYVATMLPVVTSMATLLQTDPTLFYFGLLVGATLGGNLTPIGASANIAAMGMLRKAGYEVKTTTFMKMGVPFTMLAVMTGYLLLYLIWY